MDHRSPNPVPKDGVPEWYPLLRAYIEQVSLLRERRRSGTRAVRDIAKDEDTRDSVKSVTRSESAIFSDARGIEKSVVALGTCPIKQLFKHGLPITD